MRIRSCRRTVYAAPHQPAFSVVELLVAVGILVILLSILVPTISSARESARTLKCASGLRQWGMALSMYLMNNQQVLPQEGSFTAATVADSGTWFNELPPYVNAVPYCAVYNSATSLGPDGTGVYQNSWIWYCPSKVALDKINSGTGKNSAHYAMNDEINGSPSYPPNYGPIPISQKFTRLVAIPEPDYTAFMIESDQNTAEEAYNRMATTRHRGASNVLFIGGGVQAVKDSELAPPAFISNVWQSNPTFIWGPFRNP